MAHVRAGGPCRAGGRAEAHRLGGAQGWRRSGGGLCICCSKCNKVHFSLAVYLYIYIIKQGSRMLARISSVHMA